MIRVLIVDNDIKVCELLYDNLKEEGFDILVSNDGHDAIKIVDTQTIDLIILDTNLPDLKGEYICEYIRKKSYIPIIIISDKVKDEDKISGFKLGCDDYICKPFNPIEMLARVNALVRRCGIHKNELVRFKNGLEIDKSTRKVRFKGNEIEFTKTEYEVLCLLAFNHKRTYTREEILLIAIVEAHDKLDRAVDTHIKNIRKKIEIDAKDPKIIKTVYGVGYKFADIII